MRGKYGTNSWMNEKERKEKREQAEMGLSSLPKDRS